MAAPTNPFAATDAPTVAPPPPPRWRVVGLAAPVGLLTAVALGPLSAALHVLAFREELQERLQFQLIPIEFVMLVSCSWEAFLFGLVITPLVMSLLGWVHPGPRWRVLVQLPVIFLVASVAGWALLAPLGFLGGVWGLRLGALVATAVCIGWAFRARSIPPSP